MSEGVSPSPGGTRPGFSINTHNLIGGLIVTVLALFMLGYGFYVPNTVIPRLMLAALAVIGIAAAVGLVPVHGPRDFYGGIALVMLPALALVASAELPGQRGFAFGPGTAPRLFSFVLAALGAAVAIGGVFAEGPPIEKYKIRRPVSRHYRHSQLCRHDPAARARPRDVSGLHDLDPRIDGNAMDRKPHCRDGDDFVLHIAVRLPAQPAVPALAALLLTRG